MNNVEILSIVPHFLALVSGFAFIKNEQTKKHPNKRRSAYLYSMS